MASSRIGSGGAGALYRVRRGDWPDHSDRRMGADGARAHKTSNGRTAGLAEIPVAVNVSAKQCAHPELEAVVRRALDQSGLPAHFLELELTESISMADPEESVPMMQRMKRIGVMLSIDDFGTGYSNMSYLRRFPIDRLKLDISFVRDITTDPGSLAIADAIITMSHSLNVEVVAEGVETEGQLALLASRDCDIVQGYFFSKPLPVPRTGATAARRPAPAGGADCPADRCAIGAGARRRSPAARISRTGAGQRRVCGARDYRSAARVRTAGVPRGGGRAVRPAHAGHDRHRVRHPGQEACIRKRSASC